MAVAFSALGFGCAAMLSAQERAGELRLAVTDSTGATLCAHGRILNQVSRFALEFNTNPQGEYAARKLPFGIYRLTLESPGFAGYATLVKVQSEVPLKLSVALGVPARSESITVNDSATILDKTNAGTAYEIGAAALREHASNSPSRGLIDLVQEQPGWILEANGVLHPRGSEYDTQYVVDGIPTLDNRSPAFVSADDINDLQSVKVYTSGIPAEFGRKLGGVVEIVSKRNPPPGFHGVAEVSTGSFETQTGYLGGSYAVGRTVVSLSGNAAVTDRYLDPPVQQNYTNRGTTTGFSSSFERDLSDHDRLRLAVRQWRAGFLVPNELLQQAAGQRQNRDSQETAGQVSYQHVFSSELLGSVQARVRDLSASLQSNPQSTPIQVFQERGFREAYLSGSMGAQVGRHALKAGVDAIYNTVHENFSDQITADAINGEPIFDPLAPRNFAFKASRLDREQAFYLQDEVRFHTVAISAGLRFDRYSFVTQDTAWSPRLAVAWYVPKAGVVLRASYDRVFGTPALENLLLSTSAQVRTLAEPAAQLPLRPSRGDYYEVGVAKEILQKARWTFNYFRRNIRNLADDDTLLDTGIAFPIALHSGSVYGAESQFALPQLGPFSAWVNYSYMVATAQLPVVGGLFLGKQAEALLNSSDRIWASQDQRHTAHAGIRYQSKEKFWTALAASYGSGLPIEVEGEDATTLAGQFGGDVIRRVDLEVGRVRPSLTWDASAGVRLWQKEQRSLHLRGAVFNLTNRLNVINFASVFSGTALAPPRTASLRLRVEF